MMEQKYADFAWEKTAALLAIDSPSGYTEQAARWVCREFSEMGFSASITVKGGVLVDLGGEDAANALLLEAHADTLGGMVSQIKGSGCLKVTPLGGMNANNAEAENVKVYTRDDRVYEGTCQLHDPSIHVNGGYNDAKRSWDAMEIVLDEDVKSADDTRALGIEVGDIVCFDTSEDGGDDINHTGIYLGSGKFIHGSSAAGKVIISSMSSGYYRNAFCWGRRVL